MTIGSFFLARMAGLGRRLNGVARTQKLMLPMRDGVTLQTRHYAPAGKEKFPTLLIRVPYGLNGFATVALAYAERGFHVVLQACRGTAKSGGEFEPFVNERNDGLDTLDWIALQPWFDGRLGTAGPSYLGYAQWAISDALPKRSAMVVKVTSAEFQSIVFPGGAFALGLWLSWVQTVEALRGNPADFSRRAFSGDVERRTERAAMTLPLVEADVEAVGHRVGFWRKWFAEVLDNPGFWQAIDHTGRIDARTPPTHFVSGWHDFMLDQLLRDYRALVEAGQQPYLTVGPWTHVSRDLQLLSLKDTIDWMRAHLLGDWSGLRRDPVRIWISGSNDWCEGEAFPPCPVHSETWHLHGDRILAPRAARHAAPDRYRYDPADPTPNVGGAIFAFLGAGPVDDAVRERRADVPFYTSVPLSGDLTIIGQVEIALYARTLFPHVDFFLRLCDVDEKGRSIGICDGIVRAASDHPEAADGTRRFAFTMHAAAHTFRAGHRLRLQVSSGAHPRYARNTGTDEPIGTATTLIANEVEIFHDPEHPSAVTLPVAELR